MTNYGLHSVRIEDEVWAQAKASGMSVNQLLRKVLGLPFTETRRILSPTQDKVVRHTVPRTTVAPKPGRKPLLKPSQR